MRITAEQAIRRMLEIEQQAKALRSEHDALRGKLAAMCSGLTGVPLVIVDGVHYRLNPYATGPIFERCTDVSAHTMETDK